MLFFVIINNIQKNEIYWIRRTFNSTIISFLFPIFSMVRKILFLIYAQYYSDYLFTSCSIFIRNVMWDFIFNIKTSVKKRY